MTSIEKNLSRSSSNEKDDAVAAIELKGLRKTYANKFEALKGIDLRVEQGDFYALLGPNGAGKSTIISILCSLVEKTSGQVKIFGLDIDTHFAEAKQTLGVVPQEFNFNQFEKVQDIIVTQAGYYGMPAKLARARSERYLKALDLWDKRHVISRTLSGGMKRRLMIARALIHEPKLLILDEPTAGVDIELRRTMWDFLREVNEQGTTIILTTHYLEEAESLCRNIGIIDSGQIIENTSIKQLLRKLTKQTYILETKDDLAAAPALEHFPTRALDAHSFEVDIDEKQRLNQLYEQLEAAGVSVSSMRNKANRLEEMFVNLVSGSDWDKRFFLAMKTALRLLSE